MKTLAVLLLTCATAAAEPSIAFVHVRAGAGPLQAVVKIESAKADTLKLTSVFVTRGPKVCAKTIEPVVVKKISELADRKGTAWTGGVAKGTTWLRIEAVMDRDCPTAKPTPVVRLTFASGNIPIEVTRPFDELYPLDSRPLNR